MLKKVLKVLQKLIVSAFLLYGYNLIAGPLNLIIPINLITILLVTIFGIPALLTLIIVLVLVF